MTSQQRNTTVRGLSGRVNDAPTVGVVGLGRMGSAIAERLSERYPVLGWDLRAVAVAGVETVADAVTLAERCDVIVSSLPSAVETRQVLLDSAFRSAFERSDAVFVDASTSSPDSIRTLADELGEPGERLVDAPILGRPESCGSWTMPVGGTAGAFERVQPVLGQVASRQFHVGELGSGHSIKLLNNMMFAAINVITAEAIGACGHMGVNPEAFVEIVGGSTAATVSPLFRSLAPRMLGEDLETVFTVRLLDKDLRLAVEMCQQAGVPLISAPALQEATRRALELGLAEQDSAALVYLYRPEAKHEQ
ncbi:MAG: NAD(P)-dependent oxidoreductase [Trueperaceae bacterium]